MKTAPEGDFWAHVLGLVVAVATLGVVGLAPRCERTGAAAADAMADDCARGFAQRTAAEIRADVLRGIDGQMERGRATTGRLPSGQPLVITPSTPSTP